MRRIINICTCMALVLATTSCVQEEVVYVPALPSPSDVIAFGANLPDEATRSGSGGKTLDFSEFNICSEDDSYTLPMAVKVEDGISKCSAVDTRGAVVDSKDELTSLKAWARLYDTGDQSTASLYIPGTAFTKNSGIFYPAGGESYLWPGEGKSLDFVTVSPANIEGFEPVFDAADATRVIQFHYTVPADVAKQPDILVATAPGISGSLGESVPLDFKHIMAAVNFKVGTVVSGTIQSIKLNGIYDHGTYNISAGEWVDREVGGTNYSVALPEGGLEVSTSSTGTAINNASTAALMMIPQQLTSGAEIEVVFFDSTSRKTHTLRASIQGQVWGRNTTTNYLINIDGNYNLQIVPLDNIIDSHYVITKVEVSSEYPIWELEVSAEDEALITIQKESEVNEMAKKGFWTDKYVTKSGNSYVVQDKSARGTYKVDGTAGSNQIVYVFIPENVSGNNRIITLSLLGVGSDGYSVKELSLTQHSVKWLDPTGNNNSDEYWGCELLIEGGPIDWGFCWDGITEEYITTQGNQSQVPPGQLKHVEERLTNAGFDLNILHDPNYYINIVQKSNNNTGWLLKIDYSKIGNIEIAESLTDGYNNTLDMYNFDGISTLASLKDFIAAQDNIVYTKDSGEVDVGNTLDFAAMYAMKRNRFYLQDNGDILFPIILDKDINWYLPAKNQFPILMNSDWGQAFSFNDYYWTSTAFLVDADQDNAHSYAYINGIETIAHRAEKYLTTAIRRRTYTADVVINPDDVVIPGAGNNGPEYGEGGNSGGNTGGDIEGNT